MTVTIWILLVLCLLQTRELKAAEFRMEHKISKNIPNAVFSLAPIPIPALKSRVKLRKRFVVPVKTKSTLPSSTPGRVTERKKSTPTP